MFGQPDDQQMGAQSGVVPPQNPAMLDNVSTGQPSGGQQQPDPTFTPMGDGSNGQQQPSQPVMNQPMPPQQSMGTQQMQQPGPMYQPPADHTHHYQPPAQSSSQASFAPDVGGIDRQKLNDLKKAAMHELEGLVDKIDGDPEQVFRTTMMMIQANDNHALLDRALETAKKITDDKKRAEALMDVVNEINYFSQSSQ